MLRLKNNITNIKREKRLLDIVQSNVEVTSSGCSITIKTRTPHQLKNNDRILLSFKIEEFDSWDKVLKHFTKGYKIARLTKIQIVTATDIKGDVINIEYEPGYYINENGVPTKVSNASLNDVLSKYSSFRDKISVSTVDETTFHFNLKRYKKLYVKRVSDTEECGIFNVNEILPILLSPSDTFFVRRLDYKYKFSHVVEQNENHLEVDVLPQGVTEYLGSDMVLFNGNVYSWVYDITWFKCTYNAENTFQYSYDTGDIISQNDILEIEDSRFIDYANSCLLNEVSIFEVNEYLNFQVAATTPINLGLDDEQNAKAYFDEVKQNLIGNVIDYEKRCFIPYLNRNNKLTALSKMTFNIYLRDRSGSEEWFTNDGKGWNQYPINENGEFQLNDKLTDGDLVSVLGFTDDDIHYRKKKVEKTFIRLSFYDSTDPVTQMLLFYSTIFLDSGELYTKYIRNVSKNDTTTPIVLSDQFDSDNLTISFSVTDKYNRNKSSEGFYLYLFPDGVHNGEKRTIYMKAEFNNAKTGQTVPLIYPHTNQQLTFKSKAFPKSLLTEDGDLSELFRQMYIPLIVTYDKDKKDYIYYFDVPINNVVDSKEIILGLYEPKLNPLN